jgi:hypothetical protein
VVNELVIYDREPPSIDEIVIALINRLAQTEQGRKKSKFERHRLIYKGECQANISPQTGSEALLLDFQPLCAR